MWHNRVTQPALCLICVAKKNSETYVCDLCKVSKETAAFPASMVRNRGNQKRRFLCTDCAHPPCASKHCKTCPRCRDPACRKTTRRDHCQAAIESLNAKQLPTTIGDVQEFLCQKCRFITCVRKNPEGVWCGKEMQKKYAKTFTDSTTHAIRLW